MSPAPHRLRYALSACAGARVRVTPDRRRLLETLAAATVPTVVEDLVKTLTDDTGAHAVTFYRFLAQLESRGIVHRISLLRRRAVMLACEAIDYVVCVECGSVTHLDEPPELRSWQAALAARTGYKLARHWHELAGICPGCRNPPSP